MHISEFQRRRLTWRRHNASNCNLPACGTTDRESSSRTRFDDQNERNPLLCTYISRPFLHLSYPLSNYIWIWGGASHMVSKDNFAPSVCRLTIKNFRWDISFVFRACRLKYQLQRSHRQYQQRGFILTDLLVQKAQYTDRDASTFQANPRPP